MTKYFTPMNQKPSLLQNFNNIVNSPMQSQKVISKMPGKDKQHLQNIIHDEKLAASEKAEMKQYAIDMAARTKQEALRAAQGEFEGQLDKMIAPTEGESIGAYINSGVLRAKAFFGDKMAEHALQKMAAKKALEKGTEKVLEKGTEKALSKGAMANIALDAAGVDVKEGLSDATGSNQLGGMAGGALKAGLSSGFNPVAMGAGALMGLMSGAEADRERKRQAQAQALRAKAGGQINKARAQANLARSMQNTLLSGLQRKVNL